MTAGMGIFDAMQVQQAPFATPQSTRPMAPCSQNPQMTSLLLLQICHAEIHTFCFGLAASMGAFLLGAGAKGKRASMPNSRIMIHQPLGGCSGQAVDIEIQAREIMYHKANINRIMADYTGQPISKVGPSAVCCLACSTTQLQVVSWA